MPEKRTPEELVELAQEIRRRVNEKVQNAARHPSAGGTAAREEEARRIWERTVVRAGEMQEASLRAEREARAAEKEARDDDYWDLGKPKPRVYAKPEFRSHSVGVTDVSAPDPEPSRDEAASEKIVKDDVPRRSFGAFDSLEQTSGGPSGGPTGGSSGRVVRTAEG